MSLIEHFIIILQKNPATQIWNVSKASLPELFQEVDYNSKKIAQKAFSNSNHLHFSTNLANLHKIVSFYRLQITKL